MLLSKQILLFGGTMSNISRVDRVLTIGKMIQFFRGSSKGVIQKNSTVRVPVRQLHCRLVEEKRLIVASLRGAPFVEGVILDPVYHKSGFSQIRLRLASRDFYVFCLNDHIDVLKP